MAIKKALGGFEDLMFGFERITQFRKDHYEEITEINSNHLPHTATLSVRQKLDELVAEDEDLSRRITEHVDMDDNPHHTTFTQVGAAPTEHSHQIEDVAGLGNELGDRYIKNQVFGRHEFINQNEGAAGAGLPLVLDSTGKIDASFLGNGLYFVGEFTPTGVEEYPDTSAYEVGAFWIVEGLSVAGYDFLAGDLVSRTAFNGNLMVHGEASWGLQEGIETPSDYYRIDGTNAIIASFQAGNQRLVNLADGVDPKDAVTVNQISPLLTQYLKLDGTTEMEQTLPMGGHRINNMADASDITDAVPLGQMNGALALKASLAGAGFNGHITVPAGSSGDQVPQRQEVVGSATSGNEHAIPTMVRMSQADYDAITPDADTLYVIRG